MKPKLVVLLVVCLGPGLAPGSSGCCPFSIPPYRGPKSDHFDGKRFFNRVRYKRKTFGDLVRWAFNRRQGKWPEWIYTGPGPVPPRRVGKGRLRITFVNHATTLIQMDGLNILTDPVWSMRVGPLPWAGIKRVRAPGIRFDELPPIDYVVISHSHYDHMDLPTLRRLAKKHRPTIFAGLGNARFLKSKGVSGAVDLDWGKSVPLRNGVRLHGVPAQHWSQRGICDRDRSLWLGYVIRSAAGGVYFAGDTGWGPHFAAIGRKFGPLRLALLPIGAYQPRWFMKHMHISPMEAVLAARLLRARVSVPIHWGTFPLGDDGPGSAVRALRTSVKLARPPAPRFWLLRFGQGRDVPPLDRQ